MPPPSTVPWSLRQYRPVTPATSTSPVRRATSTGIAPLTPPGPDRDRCTVPPAMGSSSATMVSVPSPCRRVASQRMASVRPFEELDVHAYGRVGVEPRRVSCGYVVSTPSPRPQRLTRAAQFLRDGHGVSHRPVLPHLRRRVVQVPSLHTGVNVPRVLRHVRVVAEPGPDVPPPARRPKQDRVPVHLNDRPRSPLRNIDLPKVERQVRPRLALIRPVLQDERTVVSIEVMRKLDA